MIARSEGSQFIALQHTPPRKQFGKAQDDCCLDKNSPALPNKNPQIPARHQK